MSPFRVVWLLHRWLGIAVGVVLMMSAVTGLLLLMKKDHEWLQPSAMACADGTVDELQPLPRVLEAVFALGLPEFRGVDDVKKIDFRPQKRLHKVISEHRDLEVQVCAITLQTSPPRVRRSDWLENLHDGSWFGSFAHDWLMRGVAVVLFGLAASGYVMWLVPKLRRRRRRRAG